MYQPPKDWVKGVDYFNPAEEHRKEEKMYLDEMLRTLKSIDENTANLSTLVDLIATSNSNQDEIIEIIKEFLNIATIKENPQEARSMYRKVMDKIYTVAGDADTIMKLVSFGTLIGTILTNLRIM